ncbi:MAG: SCP2 sterol-binding domain-containing protein [Myxococcota bacterium]
MSADPQDFYTRRVAAQWNKTLDEQESGSVREAMEGVDATIRVLVRGNTEEIFHLNIAKGRMTADDDDAQAPFLTLAHDLDAFAILEKESGDSVLGFLGGLAGLEESMKLTTGRMQNLANMEGTLRFALTGEGGFEMLVHFGAGPVADETRCSLEIAREAYDKLRTGELNPQEAFMSQQISVEGDMQMAMQLALAAMTPD